MSGVLKKRSTPQRLELSSLTENSVSRDACSGSSERLLQRQSGDVGCVAVCHLGHQVLPVEHHDSNASGLMGRQGKQPRPKRMRALKDEAANRVELLRPAPRYLHAHLDFIYYACMVPYKRDSLLAGQEMPATKKRWMSVLFYLQKAVFWMFMILASLQGVVYAKEGFIDFLLDRTPTRFVDFGSTLVLFSIGILWTIQWTLWTNRVCCMLDSIEIYEERNLEVNVQKNGGMRQNTENPFKLVLLFEMISWTAAICKSVYVEGFPDWNLKGAVLESAEVNARMLLDWNVHISNDTDRDYWHESYGEQLNAASLSMGCFGILMRFASKLLMITIRDTFFVLTCTLGSNLWRFLSKISDFANLPTEEVRDEDCQEMEEHWATFLIARDMVKDMNWAFGTLIKLLHVANALFLSYFMQNCLDGETPGMILFWMLLTISKFLYGYFCAAFIHQYNTVCESWIMNWSRGTGVIKIQNGAVKASSILRQLEREPLAIGDGNFVVNQLFVFKFICFGVTLVMGYIAEAKQG